MRLLTTSRAAENTNRYVIRGHSQQQQTNNRPTTDGRGGGVGWHDNGASRLNRYQEASLPWQMLYLWLPRQ